MTVSFSPPPRYANTGLRCMDDPVLRHVIEQIEDLLAKGGRYSVEFKAVLKDTSPDAEGWQTNEDTGKRVIRIELEPAK